MSYHLNSPEVLKAFDLALEARSRSYSPYSGFPVGACFKLKGKDEYSSGCNVENASYGATICAERGALMASVGEKGVREFDFLVVTAKTEDPVGPCALCLQVLVEFCDPDFPIFLANHDKLMEEKKLSDFIHKPFSTIPKVVK